MLHYIFLISFLFFQTGWSATGIYYSKLFGHIHLKPYSNSSSVTTISCGEMLQINLADKNEAIDWVAVSFADKKGYVSKMHTTSEKPDCLQAKYPIFFQGLELDLTEVYLWGRLSDHIIDFETGK